MDPSVPAILHPLLQDYVDWTEAKLPGRITGAHLVGSIALGEFNPRMSDIDLVATLSSAPTGDDFEQVRDIHTGIEAKHPRWRFEGMYFQVADLGCRDDEVGAFLDFHDGKLAWSQHFGLSAVTWWTLKRRGLTVFGPPPESLQFTVDQGYLVRTQVENLNTYWASWTRRPGRILALFSDWGVQWAVLGVLRQFYTLREGEITSKAAAGKYALANVPDRWQRIIREAIAMREDPARSLYGSRVQRAVDALRFLRYIIRTCDEHDENN